MQLPIYQVDAFAERLFSGNPAAVMPLERWLPDAKMQAVAAENNLAETAFLVAVEGGYELRWFTPTVEVDLCGHATLASAHVLFEHLGYSGGELSFFTRSGELRVRRGEGGITLDFPAATMVPTAVEEAVCKALGGRAGAAVIAADNPAMVVYVFDAESAVAGLAPDYRALLAASRWPVIATAAGDERDFVSRFFGPQVGIDEDPVTGSAHCSLVPYWVQRLGRNALSARQISPRGGNLQCELRAGRVFMTGAAVTYMQGSVTLD